MTYNLPIDTLINPDNPIGSYKPTDLVIMDDNKDNFHQYANPNQKPTISRTILPAFREMESDFNNHFKGIDSKIIVDSGYRSYEYQKTVYDTKLNKLNNMVRKIITMQHSSNQTSRIYKTKLQQMRDKVEKLVAIPGTSEHQSGLAFDVAFIKKGKYTDDIKEKDPETAWLMENSWKYGFILRYPKWGNDHNAKHPVTGYKFEPWHYRYVGKEIAKIMHDENIETFEEYHEKYKKSRHR